MGIPFITMDAHNIVNDNVAQGCGYENRGQIVEISEEGPIVSFETNIAAPLVSLEAQIVAQQSGSGTPSPENVRPINGFDKVIITNNDIDTEIDLPETVYGGKLNVKTGELTITHWGDLFNGASITSVGTNSGVSYARVVGSHLSTGVRSDMLSDRYNPSSTVASGNIVWISNTQQIVWLYDDRFTDLSIAKSILDGDPVRLVYPLAEPTTVQLTPTEINTILGLNNISANTGDVALTYIRVNK